MLLSPPDGNKLESAASEDGKIYQTFNVRSHRGLRVNFSQDSTSRDEHAAASKQAVSVIQMSYDKCFCYFSQSTRTSWQLVFLLKNTFSHTFDKKGFDFAGFSSTLLQDCENVDSGSTYK